MASALHGPLPLLGSQSAIPALIYGTAWKQEKTADLVLQAIRSGFTAIDTAAQPKHYREDLVGSAVRKAVSEGLVARKDLYVSSFR
jgi:diketogulonate reductase-like aldo/keto reductase